MGSINRGQESKSHGACMQSEQFQVTRGNVFKENGKDRVGNAPAPTIEGLTSKTMQVALYLVGIHDIIS